MRSAFTFSTPWGEMYRPTLIELSTLRVDFLSALENVESGASIPAESCYQVWKDVVLTREESPDGRRSRVASSSGGYYTTVFEITLEARWLVHRGDPYGNAKLRTLVWLKGAIRRLDTIIVKVTKELEGGNEKQIERANAVARLRDLLGEDFIAQAKNLMATMILSEGTADEPKYRAITLAYELEKGGMFAALGEKPMPVTGQYTKWHEIFYDLYAPPEG